MKKQIIITLEVEDTDEYFMSDKFIKNDLECEIACCTNPYETKDIQITQIEKEESKQKGNSSQ